MSGESSRELPGTCAVVLAVALGSACCIGGGGSAQSPSTDAEAVDVEPTSGQGAPLSSQYARPEILKAASGFLDRHFGTDRDRLAALPPAELAKRLTYAVFNYCTNTRPFVELEQLFEVCRAQCAGYVYVLGGLLSSFGLETRHSGLYNIPQQGNHSVLEVEIRPGVWGLYDPTFGTFLAPDRGVDDEPFSMDSLQFALSPSEVTTHVFGAVQGPISIAARAALGELFVAGRFEHLYMRPENYVFAEDYGEDDPNLPLNLRVVIRVNGGSGAFGTQDPHVLDKAEQQFLKLTRRTYRENAEHGRVSYRLSRLGMSNRDTRALIDFRGLRPGYDYEVKLMGVNSRGSFAFTAELIEGGGVLDQRGPIRIPTGPYSIPLRVKPASDRAVLMLESYPDEGDYVRLFRIEIRELERRP